MKNIEMLRYKYFLRLKISLYKICRILFGKVLFRDKFGLKYFLWKDTRIESTILKGVRTDDESIIILLNLIFDKYRTRSISANINNRIIAFDVGAYIGVITLAIAKNIASDDLLFSFEPAKRNFRRLCDNVKLNKLENSTHLINYGVSNHEKSVNYLKLTNNPGGNYITEKIYEENNRNDYDKVPVISIAKFCKKEGIDRIDIFKVDAEGHDLKVLQGAKPLLENGNIYYIFIEYENAQSKTSSEIIELLTIDKYSIFYIVRDSNLVVRQLNNYPFRNYKPPLNMLAISNKAPFNISGLGLSVVD